MNNHGRTRPPRTLARAVDHTLDRMAQMIAQIVDRATSTAISQAAERARDGDDPLGLPNFLRVYTGNTILAHQPIAWTMDLVQARYELADEAPRADERARRALASLGKSIIASPEWRRQIRLARGPVQGSELSRAVERLLPVLSKALDAYERERGPALAASLRAALVLALAGGSEAEVRAAFGRTSWDAHAHIPASARRGKQRGEIELMRAYGMPDDEFQWAALMVAILAVVRPDRWREGAGSERAMAKMITEATLPELARMFGP